MIARALLVVPTILVPLGPARDEPLEIARVDASGFPTVVVDVVAPIRHSAEGITMGSVEVDGAAVESVSPVDPGDIAIGLVIDDRPETTPAVVTGLQGAAVELVRNASDRIQVSLGTPSGLRTALTSDRGANIARIAGITAGAPAVIPMPDVLTETVAELASSPAGDRHAVVVLGGAVELSAARVAALAEALAESGTTLHVVVPQDVSAGALARVAARTGGSTRRASQPLASMDRVTATIANRFRVTARVASGGEHRVRLTAGGERFGAGFEVAPLKPTAPEPAASVPAAVPTEQEPATGAVPPATTTQSAALDRPPPTQQGGLPLGAIGVGAAAIAAVALVGAGILFLVRRRGEDDAEMVVAEKPSLATAGTSPPVPKPVAPLPSRAETKPAAAPPVAWPVAPSPSRPRTKPAAAPPPPEPEVTPPARRRATSAASSVDRRSWTACSGHVAAPSPAEDGDGDGAEWIVAGHIRMSPALGEVWCGKRRVELTPSELGILELMITSGGRGVTGTRSSPQVNSTSPTDGTRSTRWLPRSGARPAFEAAGTPYARSGW